MGARWPPQEAGPSRWQRRRVLLLGILALSGVYAVGAAVTVPRVSRDLADRVAARLADNDITAEIEFFGQDGTLRCSAPLADPAAAVEIAESVWGVREVALASACGAENRADSTSSTSPMSTAPTTVAPSTTTASTTPTTTVPAPPLTASSSGGRLVLTGSVASNSQRSVLVAAAGVVDPANLDDRLTVDPSAPVEDDSVNLMAFLVAAMPRYLVQGEAGWNGATLFAVGVYADDAGRVAFEQVATDVGATLTLNPRPQASVADATSVEAQLNTLVAEEPILFEWGSGTISATSRATVEKVAAIAKLFGGVVIEVQGHTDSEGSAEGNLTLSEQRAQAVVVALISLGVPESDLVAKGFGESQLVLNPDGDEDPDKSRRVVFGVTATS